MPAAAPMLVTGSERAALELYGDQGYDRTTIAEIAAKAGVTQRTFFRHFTDKREVIFNGESATQARLADALAAVPDSISSLAAVLQAYRACAPVLERNRALAQARHRVISATPVLRERELGKQASLSAIVADSLRERGCAQGRATLLAQVTTAALSHAIHTWVADPRRDLDALIVEAFTDLRVFGDLAATP